MRHEDLILGENPGEGNAVGRGGVLPPVQIPLTNKDVVGIDLTHVIHTTDVAPSAAKGGNGGGNGGGGGGGGSTPAPYTSGAAGAFNITIEFKGTWTTELVDIFKASADFYSSWIVGDLADVKVAGGGKPRTIDDIVISAELTNIDGAGGILGQAGPTAVRTTGSLPATAVMQFDIADATEFNALGLFDDIVFHEMGHSLGFGSIWDRLSLVDGASHFTGAMAKQESLELFGTTVIEVETDGGAGTAGSHWDEAAYDNELMTGYINDANYFSSMSAAAFGDMGYKLATNWEATVESYIV